MTKTLLIIIGIACAVIGIVVIIRYHKPNNPAIVAHEQPNDKKLAIIIQNRLEGRGIPGLEQQKTVYLPDDYGFLVNWYDGEKSEFYLYNQPSKTIIFTTVFNEFLAGLKKFPAGAKVDWIDKCQISFYRCMPDAERKRLRQTIKTKRFKLITNEEDRNCMIDACEWDFTLLKATK